MPDSTPPLSGLNDNISLLSGLNENIQPHANDPMLSPSNTVAPKLRKDDLDDINLSRKMNAHEPVYESMKVEKPRCRADNYVDCAKEYKGDRWHCNIDDADSDNPPHKNAASFAEKQPTRIKTDGT